MFLSDINENGLAVLSYGGYPSSNHLGSQFHRRVTGRGLELSILLDKAVE
jgi:hypothetical protein